MKYTIFVLTPNPQTNSDDRPNLIIWADDEKTARKQAQDYVEPLRSMSENVPLDIQNRDLDFYTNRNKVTCSPIPNDWELEEQDNNHVYVTYKHCPKKRKCARCHFILTKNNVKKFINPNH